MDESPSSSQTTVPVCNEIDVQKELQECAEALEREERAQLPTLEQLEHCHERLVRQASRITDLAMQAIVLQRTLLRVQKFGRAVQCTYTRQSTVFENDVQRVVAQGSHNEKMTVVERYSGPRTVRQRLQRDEHVRKYSSWCEQPEHASNTVVPTGSHPRWLREAANTLEDSPEFRQRYPCPRGQVKRLRTAENDQVEKDPQ